MKVNVKRSATLGQNETRTADLAAGSDVWGLLRRLDIPVEDVGVLSVNGRQATLDRVLEEGDEVYIVAPIGGG